VPISDKRALENERLFQEANEHIDDRRKELHLSGLTPCLCECEDQRCTELIQLSRDEYAGIRSRRGQFLIAPGHPTRGMPVERNDRYVVVAKDEDE
jgi:hypothetical protein